MFRLSEDVEDIRYVQKVLPETVKKWYEALRDSIEGSNNA